uniref:RNA polymerase sigma factor n=1 Tax=Roseihalotalea indica TaxID=2867963 RepID=A0AA49JE69_9BACT|nr:RNA polymerase sigma factor [Tunicatimonas sp. TK19036]
MEQTYTEDQILIQRIKSGDEASLVEIYKQHRPAFLQWAQHSYRVDEEKAADAFQDAVVCLYRNIVQGKLETLTSSLKTYLFAIGKNVIRKKFQQPVALETDELWMVENLHAEPIDQFATNERQQLVARLMETIGEPCKSILEMFYFRGFSMEAIAERLKYKNENVVKTQKLRCLTSLKNMVRERYQSEDLM